jgi:hypothetical protein
MNGGDKQQTTTNTAPWPGAQPALTTALKGAQDLYGSGTGAQVYTGSTVVPFSSHNLDAQNVIRNAADANMGGKGASGQYQGIIDSGGYNGAQMDALNNTKSLANSSWSVSPELQKIIDQTNADANTNVSLANSAGGRYGSGMANSAVADAVSKNTNSLLYNDLSAFNSRKDAANSNLFNMGQTGVGNLGTAYQGLQAPADGLFKLGQLNEDMYSRQLNDKLRVFNEQQSTPWENLSRLNAIASGAGQLGSTSTQSQPGQNPFLTALGYGTGAAGLLGSFGF